jgi:hypothetical protein
VNAESALKGALPAGAAKPRTCSHFSLVDGQPLQLGLSIPNHPLHPAAADLRLVVNTIRRARSHWWIRDVRRHHREYPDCSCRHCVGWGRAA